MIKAIIFDMDGLMFDTEALNAAAWKAAGRLHGFEIPDELLRAHIGFNAEASKKLMQNHFGPGFDFDAVRSDRIAHSLRHIEENGMPLKPGLRELLAYLDKKGLKTAIASSSEERFVRFYLDHATLGHEFDVMIPDLLPPTPEVEKLFFRKADALTDVVSLIESLDSPLGSYRHGQ